MKDRERNRIVNKLVVKFLVSPKLCVNFQPWRMVPLTPMMFKVQLYIKSCQTVKTSTGSVTSLLTPNIELEIIELIVTMYIISN